MLEIIYCEEILFDLPPPTLFYRADKNGFEKLMFVIEQMLISRREVCLNDQEFVQITGTSRKIIFRPFASQILLKINESSIITDISVDDWKTLIEKFVKIIDSGNSLTYF